MDKERKDFNLSFEIKQIDNEIPMSFEAYGSTTGNKDLMNDVIEPGAFKSVIDEAKETKNFPKLLYQHKQDKVIGVITDLIEDEKGLLIKGHFIDTTLGRDVYIEVKSGAINQMSIGFSINEYSIDEKKKVRIIKDIAKLFEVSFVTFPANPKAEVLNVKTSEGTINPRYIEKCLRDAGLSRAEAKKIISGGVSTLKQCDAENVEKQDETNIILQDLIKIFN